MFRCLFMNHPTMASDTIDIDSGMSKKKPCSANAARQIWLARKVAISSASRFAKTVNCFTTNVGVVGRASIAERLGMRAPQPTVPGSGHR